MKDVFRLVAVTAMTWLFVGTAFPDEPKDSKEIERLIKQLGSKEDTVHEAAAKHLEALGDPVLAPLKAAAVNGDFDTRLRADLLLEALTKRLEVRRFEGHANNVMSVAFSPDGKQALSGGWDPVVRLWDLEKGQELRRFEGHTETVWGVAFSPDGRRVLTCSGTLHGFGEPRDRTVRLWDAASGKELHRMEGHARAVRGVAFSPDGRRALSGGEDRTVRLWDLETGKELRQFDGHTSHVLSVAVSPDGRYGLSSSGGVEAADTGGLGKDHTVRLWDLSTGKELRCCQGHTNIVLHAVFSRDGRRALSASWDHTVRLWDLSTGKELRRFEGHEDRVEKVALSPDGRRALSVGWDNTMRLWDVATGNELLCFRGHTSFVTALAFSPDGRRALSGSGDKTMRLWRLPEFKTDRKR